MVNGKENRCQTSTSDPRTNPLKHTTPNSKNTPNSVQRTKVPSKLHSKTYSNTTAGNPTSRSFVRSRITQRKISASKPDGEVVDAFGLPHGYWEAKDTQDDLYTEADKKFAAGYPSKNIVVQSPTHALLYQHGQLQLDLDITEPRNLISVLQTFFAYQEENISAWYTAVSEFRKTVPELGDKLAALVETERQNNPHFQDAFTRFHEQCRVSINPNLSIAAVEEMLIQHLLTERIFRTVFDNPRLYPPQYYRP